MWQPMEAYWISRSRGFLCVGDAPGNEEPCNNLSAKNYKRIHLVALAVVVFL